jgi:hypothetical protein
MAVYCVDIDGDLSTDDAVCLVDCTNQACPDGTMCNALAEDAGAVCVP